MQQAQEYLLSILRDKETSRATFRTTAHALSRLLALETLNELHSPRKT